MKKIFVFVLLLSQLVSFSQINNLTKLENYYAIKPQYNNAKNFSDGLAAVQINKLWGYIDKTSKIIIDTTYDNAFEFNSSIALVYQIDGYIYIGKDGKQAFSDKYEDANSFNENFAIVDKDGLAEYSVIDIKGNPLSIPKCDYITNFSQGLAGFQKNRKWGFINTKEKVKIKPTYQRATYFSEQLCAVKLNDKWGFIDHANKKIIDFKYDQVSNFSEGLAAAKENDKWGYIDKTGNWVVEPILDNAYAFNDGLACVGITDNNNVLYGYIKNPLTFKVEVTIPDDEVKNEGSYKNCNETVTGWQGDITNIHKIETTKNKIRIKWEHINNTYSIMVFEGKGIKGKEIFKEKKIEYTGEKEIKIKSNIKFITVQIIAKKENTEWKYIIECL